MPKTTNKKSESEVYASLKRNLERLDVLVIPLLQMATFKIESLEHRVVLYYENPNGLPVCIMGNVVVDRLFKRKNFTQMPMRISGVRAMGISFAGILKPAGMYDALTIQRYQDNLGIVMAASKLLERVKRIKKPPETQEQ